MRPALQPISRRRCLASPFCSAVASGAQPVYLFTSFHGYGEDVLRYLYFFDGCRWTAVPGTVLQPSAGPGKLMRDPSLMRGPDGAFHLVWTTGWRGDEGFRYARSNDLIHWSGQRFIPVMRHETSTVNVWAPELLYGVAADHIIIIWASTIPGRFPDRLEAHDNNHRMYYTTTRDFQSFSPARLFLAPCFSAIDCFIVKDNSLPTSASACPSAAARSAHGATSPNRSPPISPKAPRR